MVYLEEAQLSTCCYCYDWRLLCSPDSLCLFPHYYSPNTTVLFTISFISNQPFFKPGENIDFVYIMWRCVCNINSYSTLLNWPFVNLLILFILFIMLFVLIHDYTLCFTGSPCCNFSYYNYISMWPYYIVIHLTYTIQTICSCWCSAYWLALFSWPHSIFKEALFKVMLYAIPYLLKIVNNPVKPSPCHVWWQIIRSTGEAAISETAGYELNSSWIL